MAETEPAASAAPIVASYFGGNSGIPSYEALKQRRAIALALAARRMKAPQTVGEGMTYFGESLNDALGTYLTGQAEQAYTGEQRRRAELASQIPLSEDAAPPPPVAAPPPVVAPRANAAPSPAPPAASGPMAGNVPVMAQGGDEGGDGDIRAQIAQAWGNQGQDNTPPPPPVQLATLGNTGATMTDAPPVGAEPRLPPNPQIVTNDIKPVQVAQASGIPAPLETVPGRAPPPITSLPVDPNAFKVERQPYPKLAPMGPRERQLFGIANSIDDPTEKARVQSYVGELEKQRQADHARRVDEWRKTEELNNAKALTLQRAEIERPAREAAQQAAKDAERQRQEDIASGGFPGSREMFAKKLLEDAPKKQTIEGTAAALRNIRPLMETMYSDPTANPRVFIDKALQFFGREPDAKLSNTQAFQAFVKELYGPLRQSVIGPGAQSNMEGRNLENAVAGNISLQPQAIKMVLDAIDKQNYRAAIDYQKPIATFTGNDPKLQQNWYNRVGLNMEDVIPQSHINDLKAMGMKDPAEFDAFDKANHTPGLSRRIIERGR